MLQAGNLNMLEKIGISGLKTKDYGFKGELFTKEEDFIVQEIEDGGQILSIDTISHDSLEDQKDFLTFTLVKKGLSTQEAVKQISRANHLNIKRIAANGNKDKNAITAQRISIFRAKPEAIKKEYQRMFLKDFVFSEKPCRIGALYGNRFTVIARNFEGSDEKLEEAKNDLTKGIQNFYGPQRFGSSALNIDVSRAIIARDFKKAVYLLCLEDRIESENSKQARLMLKNIFSKFILDDAEIDMKAAESALQGIPYFMFSEKEILSALIKNRHDYVGALRLMPKYFRLLILQSYQSYLFNRVLSSFESVEEIPESIPAIGYDMHIGESKAYEIIRRVMEQEGIESLDQLKIAQIPEASLKTFEREGLIKPEALEFKRDGKDLIISFSLRKGSYATVLLMKIFDL